jgi:hypothetical protein
MRLDRRLRRLLPPGERYGGPNRGLTPAAHTLPQGETLACSILYCKNTKKQYMAKRPVEPLAGVAPDQFFAPEDFINEKFIKDPKRQKYSKYEKRGGYAEKKNIFRAKKNHPKPLMFIEIL